MTKRIGRFFVFAGLLGMCLPSVVLGAGSVAFRPGLRQAEDRPVGPEASSGQEQFQPLLSTVSNDKAAQDVMIANTYQVKDIHINSETNEKKSGYFTAFRLHKNWFLTCAHGPFQLCNPENNSVLPVQVSVKARPDAPGGSAPFTLVVDLTVSPKQANGKVFLLNGELKLDNTNTGRGEDLALIWVPDEDPSASALKPADDFMKSVRGLVPEESLSAITHVKKQASSQWEKFMRYPIPSFHLFILSERTIIDELTPFPLTAYYIHDDKSKKVTTFSFKSIGTRRGTDAIFYERVNNLIPGTSGSPMTYGNYVVSVDSATNCSPMLTDKFYEFLKKSMGKDYSKGMCVRAAEAEGGNSQPVYGKNEKNWNNGSPKK